MFTALKEAESNRVLEIREELEALEAEREVYSSPAQGQGTSSSGYSRAGADRKQPLCPSPLLRRVLKAASRSRSSSSKQRPGGRERERGLGGAISYLVASLLDEKRR